MKRFHKQFNHCRELTDLTQKEVGRAINRSSSTISKLESGGKVAVPDRTEMDIVVGLFRKEGVPEDEITRLYASWEIAYGAKKVSPKLDVSATNVIGKVSEELNPLERDLFINDVKKIANLWLIEHRTDENFKVGISTFTKTEQELTEIINSIENGLILRARTLFLRGVQRRYMGKNRPAERDFLDALSIIEYIGNVDPRFHAEVRVETGDLYRRMEAKERGKAKVHYSNAREIYASIRDEHGLAIINLRDASLSMGAGNPQEDFDLCKKSLDYAQQTGDRGLERKALEYLAWANSMIGQMDKALVLQKEAYEIAKVLGLHAKEIAKSLRYLGDFYQQCGLIQDAENAYLDANRYIGKTREKMEELGAEKEIILRGWVLLGLSGIYMRKTEKRRDAFECVRESLDIAREIEDTALIGLSYTKEGELYLEDEMVDKARRSFERAKDQFEKSGLSEIVKNGNHNPYYLTALELNLAKLEYTSTNLSSAQERALSVIENAERFGFAEYLVKAKLFLSKVYLSSPRIDPEKPFDLYTSANKKALSLSFYLLQDVLTTVKEDIYQLRKRDENLAIILMKRMLNEWPLDIQSSTDNRTSSALIRWLAELEEEMDRLRD